MSVAKKKCKQCKEFEYAKKGVKFPAGFFCSIDHALLFAQDKRDKDRARQIQKVRLSQAKKDKADRAHLRARKEAIKTKAKWLSELQAVFNKYIRLRDARDGCISCDKPSTWKGQWHCSHYYSRGHSSALRFNLWNCHKSCSVCNMRLSGNIGQYTPRLIEKIGQDRFDRLGSHKSDQAKYDIDWIKRAIKIARKSVKKLEKRL